MVSTDCRGLQMGRRSPPHQTIVSSKFGIRPRAIALHHPPRKDNTILVCGIQDGSTHMFDE